MSATLPAHAPVARRGEADVLRVAAFRPGGGALERRRDDLLAAVGKRLEVARYNLNPLESKL